MSGQNKATKNRNKDMKKPQMSYWQSCQLRAIHQIGKVKISDIIRDRNKYPGFVPFSSATIYRHAKLPLDGTDVFDKRTLNKGRPPLLNERDYRLMKRQISVLREFEGSFSSRRLQSQSLGDRVSNSTLRRGLRKLGYRHYRTRKKGLLSKCDVKNRLKYARKIKKLELGFDFWTKGISFYLDATGFEYKRNPMDQARAPGAREWRLINEGTKLGCTSKGKKEGTTQAKFMVAISYKCGVVLCEQLTKRMNGKSFAKLVCDHFPLAFSISINPKSKRLLQDGCPVQNSKKAKRAFDRIGAHLFCIPARSPDINPIENLFHLVGRKLKQQALVKKITSETYEEFSLRVKNTLLEYPSGEIDKIIESMDKRISDIIKAKGHRIKY